MLTRRRLGLSVSLAIFLVPLPWWLLVSDGHAACNLIPIAGRIFPSTLAGTPSGSVSAPIAAPDTIVRISVGSCDSLLPVGFTGFQGTETVTLEFQPPSGQNTTVPVANVFGTCSGGGNDGGLCQSVSACPGGGTCGGSTLAFAIPQTTAYNSPDGLAGKAVITVKDTLDRTIASIGPLYQPAQVATQDCNRPPDGIFQHFTVLPIPNDVFAQTNSASRILMTLDGGGNLLIPLNHAGGDVLPLGSGAPVARLLRGDSYYPAFLANPTLGFSDALKARLVANDSEDLLRAFAIDGRPLPPLLRLDADGKVFGTTDADRSVLRITRLDPSYSDPNNPAAAIFDMTDRFQNGKGPIVINPAFTITKCAPVPLRGLRSSHGAAAFARDETLATEPLDLNGDGLRDDRVVQLIDAGAGGAGCGTLTGKAVTELSDPRLSGPVIEASNSMVAFLESEAGQNVDENVDGDKADDILRVYTPSGTEKTAALTPKVAADPAPSANGRSLVILENPALSDPLVFFRARQAGMSFVETAFSGEPVFTTMGNGLALSPGGVHLYVANLYGSLEVFSRNPTSGALTFVDVLTDGMCVAGTVGSSCPFADSACDTGPGTGDGVCLRVSPSSVALASDGAHVYVVDFDGVPNAKIFVFRRDAATGRLTFVQRLVSSLDFPTVVAVSPDGKHVYAAGSNGWVEVFSRDDVPGSPTYGKLTSIQFVADNNSTIDGIDGAHSLVFSPNGAQLYVGSTDSAGGPFNGAVAVFTRNPATGFLTELEFHRDGALGVDGIGNYNFFASNSLAVSPDGAYLYAIGRSDNALAIFSRNPVTGALTFVQKVAQGGGIEGLDGPQSVVVSPDGTRVYVTANFALNPGGSVAAFDRNPTTGLLTFVEAELEGVEGVYGPDGAGIVTISPDGAHVYVGHSLADTGYGVVVLRASSAMRVFDTGTMALRPAAATGASTIAVSGTRAALLTPEGNRGGTYLNGDSDKADEVVQIYDAAANTLTSLGVAANRVALSPSLVAFTVPEANEGDAPVSRNPPDTDIYDDVLAVRALPSGTTENLGVAADAIAVTGTTVVFTRPEYAEANSGMDLNIDGDVSDRVLHVYRVGAPNPLTNIGQAAEEFVVEGNLVAFRTSEAAQGNTKLNGDGDTADAVMQVYDLASDRLINTGQAAIPCTIGGCEDKSPYRIKGDTVTFLTRESDQGVDLNGDHDTLDLVLQVFNVHDQKVVSFTTLIDKDPGAGGPLPTEFLGQPILYVEGEDTGNINPNLDTIVYIAGDTDGDGMFDDLDTCVERSNPDQQDIDRDGLGDTCDPAPFCGTFVPAPPLLAPIAAAACQKAIGKAASTYLDKRAVAVRKCLDGIAKGDVNADPVTFCRGSFFRTNEIPPQDFTTAQKIALARVKLADKVASKCSSGEVALLDTCATTTQTAAEAAECVIAAYGTGVNDAADLAYGAVTASGFTGVEKCQLAVGSESRKYLAAVTKAMQKCLDKVNAEKIFGDPQAMCLGSLSSGGVNLPGDASTGAKILAAQEKLRAALGAKCPGTELQSLDVCGGVATSSTQASECLACTDWRRAVAGIQGAYGPQ